MLQDERNVRGPVHPWHQLYVIAEAIVGQFLVLGRRQRIRLNDRRRTRKLEVSFELQLKPVDLEKCSLANRAFQLWQTFQVVGVIPVDVAQVQVGPVDNPALRQLKRSAAPLQQLRETLHRIEQ